MELSFLLLCYNLVDRKLDQDGDVPFVWKGCKLPGQYLVPNKEIRGALCVCVRILLMMLWLAAGDIINELDNKRMV